jgi:hypothetical protein
MRIPDPLIAPAVGRQDCVNLFVRVDREADLPQPIRAVHVSGGLADKLDSVGRQGQRHRNYHDQ